MRLAGPFPSISRCRIFNVIGKSVSDGDYISRTFVYVGEGVPLWGDVGAFAAEVAVDHILGVVVLGCSAAVA